MTLLKMFIKKIFKCDNYYKDLSHKERSERGLSDGKRGRFQ